MPAPAPELAQDTVDDLPAGVRLQAHPAQQSKGSVNPAIMPMAPPAAPAMSSSSMQQTGAGYLSTTAAGKRRMIYVGETIPEHPSPLRRSLLDAAAAAAGADLDEPLAGAPATLAESSADDDERLSTTGDLTAGESEPSSSRPSINDLASGSSSALNTAPRRRSGLRRFSSSSSSTMLGGGSMASSRSASLASLHRLFAPPVPTPGDYFPCPPGADKDEGGEDGDAPGAAW